MKKIENHVHFGANIDAGVGFALDVIEKDSHFQLFPIDADGHILPYEDKPFPRLVFESLDERGVSLPYPLKDLEPGESAKIEFVGTQITVTANAENGITLNGKEATLYSRDLERKRFKIKRK